MSTRYISSYVNGVRIRTYGGVKKEEISKMLRDTLDDVIDITKGGLFREEDFRCGVNYFEIGIMKRNKRSKHGIRIKGKVWYCSTAIDDYRRPYYKLRIHSIGKVSYSRAYEDAQYEKLIEGGELNGYV